MLLNDYSTAFSSAQYVYPGFFVRRFQPLHTVAVRAFREESLNFAHVPFFAY